MTFRAYAGYFRSENGWRICDRNECVVVPGPFMDTAPIRSGPAAVVLGDFARRYHDECAPIISPVWGWSPTNTVPNSNHLSGTALDINAPQWPWGHLQMPDDLVGRIESLLADYDECVFWGREWDRPDEMHFQIGVGEDDERLAAVAERISTGIRPRPPQPQPVSLYVQTGFAQLIPPSRRPR